GGGQRLELLDENALGGGGVVDINIAPLAAGELGQILDKTLIPFGADTDDVEANFFLPGLLRQLTAGGFAGGLAIGQHNELRQLAGPGELLDRADGQLDALIHRGAARINVEHIDLADDIFDLGLVGESDDGDGIVALELLDGSDGGVLNAFETTDAGAVLLVHRTADVEYQGQVEVKWFAGTGTGGDELDEGVTGRRLARHGDAAAVHHALNVNLGLRRW